jgi:hypothetical protein
MNQAVGAATVGDRFTDHDLSAPHLTREVGVQILLELSKIASSSSGCTGGCSGDFAITVYHCWESC